MPDNNLLIKNGWFGTSIFLYYYRNLESETIEKFNVQHVNELSRFTVAAGYQTIIT